MRKNIISLGAILLLVAALLLIIPKIIWAGFTIIGFILIILGILKR